ncbi:amidase domain-containing protein [Thalassospira sp. MA62]|nr:amidase domain-containing protein [Thalassospira sp. MA62]
MSFVKKTNLFMASSLMLSLATGVTGVSAESSDKNVENILVLDAADEKQTTIGEIEVLLLDYFKSQNLSYELNSPEIVDYFVGVSLEDADEELAKHPDYSLIRYYISEYLYELEKFQMDQNSDASFEDYNLDHISDKTIEDIQEEIALEEKFVDRTVPDRKSQMMAISTMSTYSVSDSIAYARKWAKGFNPLYKNHFKDCTNFVSQAILAGGKSERKPSSVPTGITNTTSYWYSDRYEEWRTNHYAYAWKESSSWIGVVDFHTYWSKYVTVTAPTTSKTTIRNQATLGDILQFKNAEGRWFHSMIVTKRESKEIYLAGHTVPSLDKAFAETSGGTAFRLIRF